MPQKQSVNTGLDDNMVLREAKALSMDKSAAADVLCGCAFCCTFLQFTALSFSICRQMKDRKPLFDRKCHVLYSKPCKKEIRAKIALHYPTAERETVWERVQRQYAEFLSDWRTDLGGRKNFHNGVGGTCDCIAIISYYVVCKAVTSFREIEEREENLILPIFRRLRFVDCNKPFWRKLMHRAFVRAKSGCDKWHDYEMTVAPYENGKPIQRR